MSPNSAGRAEKLGYTNVKVYHEGLPEWTKRNATVLSAKSLKEAFIDKSIPAVLVDVRSVAAASKGHIKGAVSLPAADIAAGISKFPPKDQKPPIIVYDQTGGDEAGSAARTLIAAGYPVSILTGGADAWQSAGFPVEAGQLPTTIVYVPKLRPGEIPIDEFRKIAANTPADTLILDVRNHEESQAGKIKDAKCIPDEQLLDRLADIPKDKRIILHCSTGVRAEMAYHKLKDKGYNVQFVNARVDIDDKGNFKIEKP